MSSATIDYAKQLYLHGGADGKRITSTKKLAEIVGLHPDSISRAKKRDNWDDQLDSLSQTLPLRVSSQAEVVTKIGAKVVKLTEELSRVAKMLASASPTDEEYPDLLKSYLSLDKELERYNGVSQFLEVETVYAKELAKHRAKIDAQKLTDQTEKPAKGQVVTTDGVPLN